MDNRQFISKLEALRGVAALMVALGHSWLVLSVDGVPNLWARTLADIVGPQAILTRIMLIFFNGGVAVTIFFVISGFVLGLSLDRDKFPFITKCLAFYIKRIFRIIPIHLIGLAFVCSFLFYFHEYKEYPNTSIWFNWWYTAPVNQRNIFHNIVLYETNLNPITWTLQVELVLSLFFPIMHLFNRRTPFWANLFALCVFIFISYRYSSNLIPRYAFVFYLGLMVAQWGRNIWQKKTSLFCYVALFFSLLTLLLTRFFIPEKFIFLITFTEGILSTFIMSLIVFRGELQLLKILDTHPLRILGRISYSFYVFHFFILYIVATMLLKRMPSNITENFSFLLGLFLALTSIITTLSLTLPLSACIEMPLNQIGKHIVTKNFKNQA